MATARAAFDGDCDIAALVYGPGEDPDTVMAAFATRLIERGVDVAGVLQGRNTAQHCGGLVLIPSGRALDIAGCGAPAHSAFVAWSGALIQAEAWLLKAARRRPELLLLNRFGAAERAGGGLLAVIAEAAALDVPVLLPVSEAAFPDWLRFTEGLSVKLDCSLPSLEGWWSGIARAPKPDANPTFCERAK